MEELEFLFQKYREIGGMEWMDKWGRINKWEKMDRIKLELFFQIR